MPISGFADWGNGDENVGRMNLWHCGSLVKSWKRKRAIVCSTVVKRRSFLAEPSGSVRGVLVTNSDVR